MVVNLESCSAKEISRDRCYYDSLWVCQMRSKARSTFLLVSLFQILALKAPVVGWSFLMTSSSAFGTSVTSTQTDQPKIYVLPEVDIKSVVGSRLVADVYLGNISGMRGIYFELCWNAFYDPRVPGWFPVLNTSTGEITVYEDILPKPYKAYGLTVISEPEKSWLKFLCILDCATVPQNGTAKIMSINFTVLDPWDCGRQPKYVESECSWLPGNATSYIVVWWGYTVVQYPDLHYVYFGEFYGDTSGKQDYALYSGSAFTFMPVPGDLDGNGKVDATDLWIISQEYDANVAQYPNGYYDLNGDGVVDLFDVTIVARNYGRISP
jgi:hypothetical protein